MSRANDLAAMESGLLAIRGLNNAAITASKVLTADETGVVLVDATAGNVTITLPAAARSMDVRVQRVDNTGNRLVVKAAGAEKIKAHTHLRPAGYSFIVLLGVGDFWHLRSDGAGAWVPLDRLDNSALGRPVFETTTALNPGGWGVPNGGLFNRADWPWLWDHAQQSGMLTTEALRTGMEGAWTDGDGVTTFRVPELRGEFFRALDESRGVDVGRAAGSFQKGSLQSFDPNRTSYSLTGLIHTGDDTGILAKHGLDPVVFADYGQSQVVTYDSANISAITVAGGVVRPRNIAYPARIKLI
ncbi:phage tail protein [Pseudomonas oryziphila]|uniref:Phage tail protein n=1 Tax=Pseudomonas oryziphila TaxID=2894079 RepID=A0ABM7CUR1_9PSED|nr:phage tail protein [Pseudomonas oryziphila]AZL75231.1 phage tail protein [Pseudomonas oryziphila]